LHVFLLFFTRGDRLSTTLGYGVLSSHLLNPFKSCFTLRNHPYIRSPLVPVIAPCFPASIVQFLDGRSYTFLRASCTLPTLSIPRRELQRSSTFWVDEYSRIYTRFRKKRLHQSTPPPSHAVSLAFPFTQPHPPRRYLPPPSSNTKEHRTQKSRLFCRFPPRSPSRPSKDIHLTFPPSRGKPVCKEGNHAKQTINGKN